MKDKFLVIGVFFLLMASLPLLLSVRHNGTSSDSSSADGAENSVVLQAAALCEDSYSDEAVKAVMIILRTNQKANKPVQPVKKADIQPSFLKRIKQIHYSETEILTYQDKPVAVPVSKSSNGFTEAGNTPYLCAVASPWDAFGTPADAACEGVSLNGINQLCARGLSAEEALLWYLPRLRLQQAES